MWPERDDSGSTKDIDVWRADGWPSIYKFFAENYHWTHEQVDQLPMYTACIYMGALSVEDHINVKFAGNRAWENNEVYQQLRKQRKNGLQPW